MEMKSPRVNLVDRPRQGGGRRPERDADHADALYDGFGQQWSSTIYGERDAVPRAARARSEVSGAGRLAEEDLVQDAARARWCRSNRWSTSRKTSGRRPSTTSGQLPAVSISFGLQPGRVARRGHRSRQPGGRGSVLPATVTTSFQGSAKVFQAVADEPRPAALRRHRRRLHRARHALRELHPSAHDSLRPAVGRPRRARHAVAVRQRAEHLLVRRPDHADRHREEERDHADRLRARGRAPARQDADRSDLRRLPHPLPSDHDDDDGGAARRAADRARLRRRRRSAAAARPRGRRRPARSRSSSRCI